MSPPPARHGPAGRPRRTAAHDRTAGDDGAARALVSGRRHGNRRSVRVYCVESNHSSAATMASPRLHVGTSLRRGRPLRFGQRHRLPRHASQGMGSRFFCWCRRSRFPEPRPRSVTVEPIVPALPVPAVVIRVVNVRALRLFVHGVLVASCLQTLQPSPCLPRTDTFTMPRWESIDQYEKWHRHSIDIRPSVGLADRVRWKREGGALTCGLHDGSRTVTVTVRIA